MSVVRSMLATALVLASAAAAAAPTTYLGEDVSANLTIPVNSASVAAHDRFVGSLGPLTAQVANFELKAGKVDSLSMFGGLATLVDSSHTARIEDIVTSGGNTPGRFNTTAGGKGWFQTSSSFVLSFNGDTTISALGFYGTDFADFGGSLTLELMSDGRLMDTVRVDAAQQSHSSGSLLFFGFSDLSARYDAVRFVVTQANGGVDVLGFDDLLVALAPATPGSGNVPEPASLALAGIALAGAVAGRRRRSR